MTRDRKQCLGFACGEDAEKQSVREEQEKQATKPSLLHCKCNWFLLVTYFNSPQNPQELLSGSY